MSTQTTYQPADVGLRLRNSNTRACLDADVGLRLIQELSLPV